MPYGSLRNAESNECLFAAPLFLLLLAKIKNKIESSKKKGKKISVAQGFFIDLFHLTVYLSYASSWRHEGVAVVTFNAIYPFPLASAFGFCFFRVWQSGPSHYSRNGESW
jgi:hypothetical protein